MTTQSLRVLVALTIVSGCVGRAEGRVGEPERLMATATAAQAATELALGASPLPIDLDAIRVERGPMVRAGVPIHRAWIPRDHWHAYQAATVAGRLILLGGFQAPQLEQIASALIPQSPTENGMRVLAQQLMVLADPSGGVQYAFPAGSIEPALQDSWSSAKPRDWPRDTVASGAAGWRITMTLLSRETRSYTQHWVPTAYSFAFSPEGRLVAWSRRIGDPVSGAGLPVSPTATPWNTASP